MPKVKVVKVKKHAAHKTIKAANKQVAKDLEYMKEVLKMNFMLDK